MELSIVMKRVLLLFLSSLSVTALCEVKTNKTYQAYIDAYSSIAIDEMRAYGIPASITMAQGVLESGAGRSELSKRSNNHFGIKCKSDWSGEKVYHDDDAKQECFRKYPNAKASYEDHSQFLKKNPRYAPLFQLKRTDYKGWAHGLKKAGYATDPRYANRLIELIEAYDLARLDTVSVYSEPVAMAENADTAKATVAHVQTVMTSKKKTTRPKSERGVIGWMRRRVSLSEEDMRLRTQYEEKDSTAFGEIAAYRSHKISKINGVRYVIAERGDTYKSIASEFGKFECEVLKANELQFGAEPKEGDIVYLEKKKKEGAQSRYQVQKGETVYSISQKMGVRSRCVYDMNDLVYGKQVSEGDVIKLRK